LRDRAVVRHVVTFGRILREAGLEVGPQRLQDALNGLDRVELARRDDVYWTLRQTLVARADDLAAFDSAFTAWFERAPVRPPMRAVEQPQPIRPSVAFGERPKDDGSAPDGELQSKGWSAEEVLRQKDFASLSPGELEQVKKLIARAGACRPERRSRRLRPHPRGRELDLRRLVRGSLSTGGDVIERSFRRRKTVPRKLVLLCDVSGSMEAYTRALLLFVHAVVGSGRGVEAFAFGTRLTRLTPELAERDPEKAVAAAARRVVDWTGGTRIGASLKAFNDEWGRRALTRGAVIVIASDGWERGEAALVGQEMARLARAAYAVVWVNPLKGSPEYQPLAGGMRAALPYVDRFLPGHNLASLEGLGEVLAGIERRHAA
jgi:uncharacterized protein with von Willebrand factor type A (vWA) domain